MIHGATSLRSGLQAVLCVVTAYVLSVGCGTADKSAPRLLAIPDDSSDRVTARLIFGYDPAQFPVGTAWMVASAFCGAYSSDRDGDLSELTSLDATLTATTDREVVIVDITFPPPALDQVARLIAQRLSHSTLVSPRIDELRLIQHALLDSLRHDVDWLMQSAFWGAAYKGTPYALPPTGSDSSIELIQPSDLDSFRTKFITRGNYVLGLTGPVGPTDAEALDSRLQESLPTGGPANRIPPARPTVGLNVAIVELPDFPTATISVGCVAPHQSNDTAALVLAMTAVLESAPGLSLTGMDQSIRVERGLAELVSGRTSWVISTQSGIEVRGVEPSIRDFLTFTVRTHPTNALYSARVIIKEIADISTAGLTDSEIAQMHHSLRQAVAGSMDSSTRMHNLLSRLWMGIENESELLSSNTAVVSLAQTRRILRASIDPKNLQLIVVVADANRFRSEILSGTTAYMYPEWVDGSMMRRMDQEYLSYRPFWETEKIRVLHADSLFR